jgi:hypothetical protein
VNFLPAGAVKEVVTVFCLDISDYDANSLLNSSPISDPVDAVDVVSKLPNDVSIVIEFAIDSPVSVPEALTFSLPEVIP